AHLVGGPVDAFAERLLARVDAVLFDGVPAHEAVAFVRRNYDRRAVETPWQKRYVQRFTG
ncbi:hypothetical protein ABT367_39915, partial [Streptomyces mesophilus]